MDSPLLEDIHLLEKFFNPPEIYDSLWQLMPEEINTCNKNFLNPSALVSDNSWPDLGEFDLNLGKAASEEQVKETFGMIQDNSFADKRDLNAITGKEKEKAYLEKGDKGNRGKVKEMKQRFKRLLSHEMMVESYVEEGSTSSKKQQHNTMEKIRRMKLNASYFGSLLTNSRRSKVS